MTPKSATGAMPRCTTALILVALLSCVVSAATTVTAPYLPVAAPPVPWLLPPHALVDAPGAESWGYPALARALSARDDLIPTREEETHIRARELIRAGQVERGEALLRDLGAAAPSRRLRDQARRELAESLIRRGEFGAGAAACREARGAESDPWELRLWQAYALERDGRPGEAGVAYAEAAAGAPGEGRFPAILRRHAGWIHLIEGDTLAASRAWEEALASAVSYPPLADSLRVDLAETAFVAGRWEKVVALLDSLAAPSSRSARSEFLRGRALLELGEEDRAHSVLEGLLAGWPQARSDWLDEARVVLGWLALKRGETRQALTRYEEVTGSRREDLPPSRYGSAVAMMAEQRFAEAETLLAPAPPVAQDDPLFYPWVYGLAYARFHLDRHEAAIADLEAFRGRVGADSLGRAAWSLRGDCYYRMGNPEEAYASYAKASSVLPEVPELLLRRQALAAAAAAQWGTAARILGDLIVKFPGTSYASEYYFWRAEAFYNLGRLEMARRHYRRAVQQGADPGQCAYALGWCDYREARFADALAHFDQALRRCEDCPYLIDLLLRRGNCLFNTGRVEESVESFAQAAERAMADSATALGREASFRRAWALFRLEDFSSARAAFMRIREAEGSNPRGLEALYWEGQTFFRQELYDQALVRFTQLLGRPDVHDSLRARALLASGDANFNQGNYGAALEWYRQILEAPGADRALRRSAHESLFECRGARGEWDQARQILQDLESAFPETRATGDRHLQLAEGLFREKHYADALTSYGDFLERAPTEDPRLLRVRFQMARCREELHQTAAAAAAYEALGEYEGFRQRDEALLRAGTLRLELNEPRHALKPLEKRLSLSLDPAQDALTRALLAESYETLEETEAARNEWEKVVHAGAGVPDSLRAVASLHLGRMAFADREWAGAYRGFAGADSLGLPGRIYRIDYWAGESAFRMGDTLRAVTWLERFLESGEQQVLWEATARVRLAECYEGLGRPEAAADQYRSVIGLPLEEGAIQEEAERRLQLLEGGEEG